MNTQPVLACVIEHTGLCCCTVNAGRESLPHYPASEPKNGSHKLQDVRQLIYRRGDTDWFNAHDLEQLKEAARVAGVAKLPVSIYTPRHGWKDHDLLISAKKN